MASCGLNRETGLPHYDLDAVAEHVETLFATRLGEMIMLRHYGAGLATLLGRRVLPKLVAAYRALIALSLATWEPRLQVLRIDMAGSTADAVRLGHLRFRVLVLYRPRGHLGDFTVEGGPRVFDLYANDNESALLFDLAA